MIRLQDLIVNLLVVVHGHLPGCDNLSIDLEHGGAQDDFHPRGPACEFHYRNDVIRG
jgi:hypothetical protein